MALPRSKHPTYELILPSTGKKIKYRPWLTGEQKHLLMAMQGGETDIMMAVKECVNACTFGELDMINIPNFDEEYIFLQLRIKSAGQVIPLELTCQHCEHKNEYDLDIGTVQVQTHPDHKKRIMLSEEMGCEMNYPTTEQLTYLNNNYNVQTVYATIAQCLHSVFTSEEVNLVADETEEELQEWMDTLSTEDLDKIEDFFRTMPVLRHEFIHKCERCDEESKFTIEGIESFFV